MTKFRSTKPKEVEKIENIEKYYQTVGVGGEIVCVEKAQIAKRGYLGKANMLRSNGLHLGE